MASVKNTTDTDWDVYACPTAVPMKVGPPPMAPSNSSEPELGIRRVPSFAISPVRGATMPNPSVALCNAKPITSDNPPGLVRGHGIQDVWRYAGSARDDSEVVGALGGRKAGDSVSERPVRDGRSRAGLPIALPIKPCRTTCARWTTWTRWTS